MSIQFNDELKTGIFEIDSQHKALFRHVNELYLACLNGTAKEDAAKIMDYLDEYVDLHFITEESYMEKYSYSETNQHKAAHNIFRSSFQDIKNTYNESGPTANFIVKLNKSLVNWLISHMGNDDKKLAKFIKEQER